MPTGKDRWIPPAKLFDEISKRADYIDPKTVEKIYYALVKTIVSECKVAGGVRLPDLGDFTYSWQKQHRILDYRTKAYKTLPPQRTLKFVACIKLRDYLRQLGERLMNP